MCPPVEQTPPSYRKECILYRMLGLRENSRSWRDYETGKAFYQTQPLDGQSYELRIKYLTDYLGL